MFAPLHLIPNSTRMKYILIALIAICSNTLAQSDLSKGEVMIDPKGHSANIKMLRFSEDGSMVVTASDDKTARVWDVKTGALLNTVRGEIDEGNGGMLNSGALWPQKPIAVFGGFLSINGQRERIKFFNYETGEQLGYASGPKQPIVAMDFSKDGKFLVGGSNGSELLIWNLDTFNPITLSVIPMVCMVLLFRPMVKVWSREVTTAPSFFGM
jgi:FOG: WD40 repeat